MKITSFSKQLGSAHLDLRNRRAAGDYAVQLLVAGADLAVLSRIGEVFNTNSRPTFRHNEILFTGTLNQISQQQQNKQVSH